MNMRFRIVLFALIASLVPLTLGAHSSGASFEEQKGEYTIDIGYDPVDPVAGDRLVLDFELWDGDKADEVPFTRAWVRIERDKKIVLATGVGKASVGPTTLLFVLPEPGDYSLMVRYENTDGPIVEHVFPLTVREVESESGTQRQYMIAALLGGVIVFGVLLWIIVRRRTA